MSKHLVIVESPAKVKTIKKFLGSNYTVKASLGHVRDLVKSKLGVDVENDFQPQYVNIREKSRVINELKKEAEKCDNVILALDPDREGEAIAWHLRELLKKKDRKDEYFTRVTYNQITKPAIIKAFNDPGHLDMDKVNAQQARRILDRLVGYQVSPILWRRIRGGSSAGRVQTAALRLVCEREKEIMAFIPESYRVFGARVAKQTEPKDPFEIRLVKVDGKKGEIYDPGLAADLLSDLEKCRLTVDSIQTREVKKQPAPPFITSTLQQAASNAFGFQPRQTMSIAQKLYEGVELDSAEGATGLITYMRTDSVSLAKEAVDEMRTLIKDIYGRQYLPDKPVYYRSRGAAQEAHEAIRPTSAARKPESLRGVLSDKELKLYSLIWKRTVSCQMAPARIEQTVARIETDSTAHKYVFHGNASKITFPGYMAVWGRGAGEEEEDESESYLPPLDEGESLDVLEWLSEEKQTQPPKRYSEAGLIKALEEKGIGRPSTYATIITTLYNREYVERDKRILRPTSTGMEVNDFLIERLPALFEVGFTARMEEELDDIEEGKLPWTEMISSFYIRLEEWIKQAKTVHVDSSKLNNLLELASEIKYYNPPVKSGRKTYCDETFIREISEALGKNEEVTERQANHLRRVIARYHKQIPSLTAEKAAEMSLTELIDKEIKASQPPDQTTRLKLAMLENVAFEPPRKVGKKTYDNAEFTRSLREQVERGRRLSENQVRSLDNLVIRYAAQIDHFDKRALEAGLSIEIEEDHESGPLIELLKQVKNFREPTVRGKKTFDDASFADSLRKQYEARKSLTLKQRSALKKLITKYHEQIPGYEEIKEPLGLSASGVKRKVRRKKKARKE